MYGWFYRFRFCLFVFVDLRVETLVYAWAGVVFFLDDFCVELSTYLCVGWISRQGGYFTWGTIIE